MEKCKSLNHIYVLKEGNMGLVKLQAGAGFIQVWVVLQGAIS